MKILSKISNTLPVTKGLIFLDQAMVSGSNFLLGILLVRYLGLAEYGIFTLLWMAVLFALGINQALIIKPLLSIGPKLKGIKQERYLAGLHSIQFYFSLVLLGLGIGIYYGTQLFINKAFIDFIPIISVIIFGQTIHDFYRKIYLIEDRIFKVFLLDLILYGGQLLGILGLLFLGKLNLQSALCVVLIVNILSILYGKYSQSFSQKNTKKILIRHFHYSKWLLGTSILQWLSGNYFIIVGASILGTSAVGAIRMVQNLMGLCHILFLVMESIIPIEAARQFQAEGENGLINYLIKMTKQLGTGFGFLLLIISIGAAPILSLVYGPEAAPYAFIAVTYSLLYAFVFIGHPLRFYLRTIEKTSPIFIAYCIGSLFSLCSAYPLLQFFQIHGLLFGLIFTQLINILVYYFFSLKSSRTFTNNQLKESL